jgi:hypothetical protein
MKVLVVEAQQGGADAAKAALVAAGHTVVGCDTPEPHAPCLGLSSAGVCPLDDHREGRGVDVAVVHHTGRELAASERGALCAARARVPVVVDGDYRRAVSFGPGTFIAGVDLVDACTAAAGSGMAHAAAIRRELLCSGVVTAGDVSGARPRIGFHVERTPSRLRLTITMPADERRSPNIVKAAAEALRRFDPNATVIDVAVDSVVEPAVDVAVEPVDAVVADPPT